MRRPTALLALIALFAIGCPPSEDDTGDTNDTDTGTDTDEPSPTAVVTVSAPSTYLIVGDTQTLTAATLNATDAGYAWATGDALVATVDAAGVVTAIGQGTTTITATGSTSSASGQIELTVSTEIPFFDDWSGSGHADYAAEAFVHWDEEGAVPAGCAKCHTTSGFRDFVGADGTDPDTTDADHPTGQVIECGACHNPVAATLSHVVFPSGAEIDGLGPEARCMTCHQGNAAGSTVDAEIADAQATGTQPAGEDLVDPDIGFVNIHYYAAAATLLGGEARGGYEYDGQIYDRRFRHVSGRDTCVECHDPHTLEVRIEVCSDCHAGVEDLDDVRGIRMIDSSTRDYDGDGNVTEGLSQEVFGLRDKLYTALKNAAASTTGASKLCYEGAAYPYWFVDTDGNGACNGTEATFPNQYKTWTPRLVRGAYNYQLALKDPGTYVHNGKYVIQLLHDAITDLNEVATTDVDLSGAVRDDPGHFDGSSEAFRHWDENEAVEASCSKCHGGADGFAFYAQYGVSIEVLEHPNGLQCETCHGDWNYQGAVEFRSVASVVYPGGKTLTATAFSSPTDLICATCHSGRESKATIDAYLATNDGSGPGKYPTFRNVHYLPAAATLQGADAGVGYEYPAKSYSGRWGHFDTAGAVSCSLCHDGGETGHTFGVQATYDKVSAPCDSCHSVFPAGDYNGHDYDGDGVTSETTPSETLAEELAAYQDAVLEAMRSYAADDGRQPICYDSSRYPYWFVDGGTPGAHCGPEDTTGYPRSATGWDAEMVKAAHNYQLSYKDPGAWAHNMDYVTELLYDSIERLDATKLGTLSRGQP